MGVKELILSKYIFENKNTYRCLHRFLRYLVACRDRPLIQSQNYLILRYTMSYEIYSSPNKIGQKFLRNAIFAFAKMETKNVVKST